MATTNPGVWGIDLGQCALKAIRLELVDGKVTATAFDYIEHPKILSQPDADPDQLTREALEQFLSRNKIQYDMVSISVPGQSGLARFVKLPPVEEKKIADIVRFEAKQQIPFPLEEVVWDFQKIGSGVVTDGFAMETEIGLFAMKRDMVNRYLQHFKDVGVEVHLVQMSPLALCNFVAYDLLGKQTTPGVEGEASGTEKKCVVALDIGTDNSNLVITDGEKIIWQRPIPLGGNHFTRALTKDLKLTFAKAEHLKRNAVKSPDLKKILAALKTVLNDFVGEVQRSLGYFTNTHRDAQIQYMVGLGNAFRLPGLQKFLQEKLQLEVRKLQSLERVSGEEVTAAPQFTENILSFGVAYGLALQGLKLPRIQTNLLPYEIRVERMIRAKKPWGAAAAAALLLAVAGLTFARNIEFRAVDQERSPLKETLAEAKRQKGIADEFIRSWDAEDLKLKESERSILRIQAGAQERFNWNLLYEYVGMALPQPDGTKLTKSALDRMPVYDRYFKDNPKAQEARQRAIQKQFPKDSDKKPIESPEQIDEFIKKYLVQIDIEGIDGIYFDDLSEYFKALKSHVANQDFKLFGMNDDELKQVETLDSKLPKKGWVFEVRGYTYHYDEEEFVKHTILENLRNPENIGNNLEKPMKEKVRDRIGYFWARTRKEKDPTNAGFQLIGSCFIKTLREAAAGPATGADQPGAQAPASAPARQTAREAWRPIGEVAASVFGGGGGGGAVPRRDLRQGRGMVRPNRPATNQPVAQANPADQGKETVPHQPRTEFVVLFVWHEPTLEDSVTAPR